MSLIEKKLSESGPVTIYMFSPEIIVALRQASLMADRMGFVDGENGGLFIESPVNGIMRLIKVDENFERTVQEMYDNPLKKS